MSSLSRLPALPSERSDYSRGDRITKHVTLTQREVSSFARLAEDYSPLHHDEHVASLTRFGEVIVSGAQMNSLMIGLTATYFTRQQNRAMVGLEYSFRFRKAVKCGPILLEWEVVDIEPHVKLQGDLITLLGKILQAGQEMVTAQASILATDVL